MSAVVEARCPKCEKVLRVPVEHAGKKVRCKNCQSPVTVPHPGGVAKPVAAKSVAAAKKDEDAPIAMIPLAPPPPPPAHGGDPDDDANPYTIVNDGADVPRCPHCALELDPPDAKVCTKCGYDMMARKRHQSITVFEPTGGEWAAHLAPGIACAILAISLFVLQIVCFLNMREWITGSVFDMDEKDTVSGQAKFYISPFCFNIWTGVVNSFIIFFSTKFAIKRLVYNFKPEEKKKKE